jgi:hypothetical protein
MVWFRRRADFVPHRDVFVPSAIGGVEALTVFATLTVAGARVVRTEWRKRRELRAPS